MIKRKTVFVVGAGASRELEFPLGEALLQEIGKALNFDISFDTVASGDRETWAAMRQHAAKRGTQLGPYLEASHLVRDAAHVGISIDNIVHQQGDVPELGLCAKFGIARRILEAEAKSALRMQDDNRTITWPKVKGTWLGGFAQMLVQDKQRNSLDDIFDNVSVISFNYDRNIRRFLPLVLESQFALPSNIAGELSARLPIYHPYGSLGPLPWEVRAGSVQYGKVSTEALITAVGNLRTFTEQIDDESQLAGMYQTIADAERIVFLGFSYLPQNMELLVRGVPTDAREILGTSFGMSEQDRELVTRQLDLLFVEHFRAHKSAVLLDKKCADFIRENFRTLTS